MNSSQILLVLGTILSVAGWLSFVWAYGGRDTALTLSELATRSPWQRLHYRTVLWLCGALFLFAALVSTGFGQVTLIFWVMMVIFEMMAGVILPTNEVRTRIHLFFAYGMGVFMLAAGVSFAIDVWTVWLLILAMVASFVLGLTDRGRLLYYEMAFIFLSHLTFILAVFA